LQNPQLQKAKGNLLHGEKAPVSGRLRGGEKGNFPGPHPLYGIVLPLPEGGGYSWDDGFCDFAFGSAQNDSIGGDVGELNENKGWVQSFSYGADSAHQAFPN